MSNFAFIYKEQMRRITILLFLVTNFCFSQQTVDVAELTLKIGANSTEELFYGFAAGDQLLFSFEEINGKELKEIEIVGYPETVKYRDYSISKLETKSIRVNATGVYIFRFKNSNLLQGKTCKVKIQRIPANESLASFNTAVSWETRPDTTWNTITKNAIISYDTLYTPRTRKVLMKDEKLEEILLDKNQRVHSRLGKKGKNKSNIYFTLPEDESNSLESKKVIAWAYWVGVGKESNQAWQKNREIIAKVVQSVAGFVLSPLGALASGTITSLILPKMGKEVIYALADEKNGKLFSENSDYKTIDNGNGVAGYQRFIDTDLLHGKYYIVLTNDNFLQSIDVNIKVSAIIEHKKYNMETYNEMKINPTYGLKKITEPQIELKKIPVIR